MNTAINTAEAIRSGQTALGMEFGSTRIKAVLTDRKGAVLASGSYDWENSLREGIWTYGLQEIHAGLQGCYAALKKDVKEKHGVILKTIGTAGVSAMMHGYMAFDRKGELLTPFRTWRNSNTGVAAEELTKLFRFNIPLRWTVSHLYQCILDGESHVGVLDFVTTLSSYIHWRLTGERVIGIGDASGIFPVDSGTLDYDAGMMEQFDALIATNQFLWKTKELFPKVLTAGTSAGILTAEGAAFLDPEGDLQPGIPFCPPEGDAGTGMVATNAVAPGTGNVSAGTSTFAMLVLERPLKHYYREIDMVTTPAGAPVAMSHANNGTSDLNAWVSVFGEFAALIGKPVETGELFSLLYRHSLGGDPDCGGLMSYGYYSGEGVTHLSEGRPLFLRTPDSSFTLANLMRSHLYASLSAVKIGLDILFRNEDVKVRRILGHGGLFKTPGVAQRYLSAAVNAPVTVMENAGEGGPWGMALLALFLFAKENGDENSLEEWLDREVFAGLEGSTLEATEEDREGFESFTERCLAALPAERAAVETARW